MVNTTEDDDEHEAVVEHPENYVPGSFGCHEALHMASVVVDLIDSSLCQHPAIMANAEWKNLAHAALGNVFELYQQIGAVHLDAIPTEATHQRRAVDYYRNEEMDERNCDYCQKPYRGPAVYCSLACAEADA